jgi:hypothetical protein
MPHDAALGIAEAIEDLERRLPPDDPLRCVTNALRECDAALAQDVIVGDAKAGPIVWSRFIALGRVDGWTHPCFGIYPGIVDDSDRREVDRVAALLKRGRVAPFLFEDFLALDAAVARTAALALFGEGGGRPLLVVARHPDVTLPQARCLILAAAMRAAAEQERRN